SGYWWWVAPGSPAGGTAPQKFALWAASASNVAALVPGSVTSSGTLTGGQWNYVPLATPIPLAIGADYIACTGVNGNFPATDHSWGTGDTYSAGITNGPLNAFSASSGSNPSPLVVNQGLFTTASTDPAASVPFGGSNDFNTWIDVQVTDT